MDSFRKMQICPSKKEAGITFIGPAVGLLEGLGGAAKAAKKAEVPILSGGLEPRDFEAANEVAQDPVIW